MNFLFSWLPQVLLLVSFLVYIFWSYRRGSQSGFNRGKLLDLILLAPAFGVLLYKILAWLGLSSEAFFFLGFLFFSLFFSGRENWSYFRIGDVFAESSTLASVFFPYFYNPVFNLISVYVFYVLRRVAADKARTGFVFLNFLIIFSVYYSSLAILKERTWLSFNLALAIVFFFWGLSSLRRKEYRDSLALLKYSLPAEILDNLKARLLEKGKTGGSLAEARREPVRIDNQDREKNEVRLAWQRIEGGDYGLCQKCRQPIEKRRLEQRPESRLCLSCETAEGGNARDEK